MSPEKIEINGRPVASDPKRYEDGLPPAPEPERYAALRAPRRVEIDGDLSKPVWQAAPWTNDFVDIEGDLKPRPFHRTRAKMLWDEHRFYVAAEMEEPHLWGTLTQRDQVIFQDNDFEVFLDASGEGKNYYELEVNALGTLWDLHLPLPYRAGGQAETQWRFCGVEVAVRLDGTLNDPRDTDRGWQVEIAIPYASLNRHARDARGHHQLGRAPEFGETWAVDFSRVHWDLDVVDGPEGPRYQKRPNRPEYNWVWSPTGMIDMHLPRRWGQVTFEKQLAR